MADIPTDRRYTRTHEWARPEGDGTFTVGITDHAQDQLGDLVYVELPEVDQRLTAEDPCAVVESVKAASDVYSPLSGRVVAVNEDLAEAPERINEAAFAVGWLFRLEADDPAAMNDLMEAADYEALIQQG